MDKDPDPGPAVDLSRGYGNVRCLGIKILVYAISFAFFFVALLTVVTSFNNLFALKYLWYVSRDVHS